jgi:hypothetical protein
MDIEDIQPGISNHNDAQQGWNKKYGPKDILSGDNIIIQQDG